MFSRKPNIVGACIFRERKKAGLSQETLAEQLHVTRQTISNWESGRSLPDIESLKALAQALNVPIERLIYDQQAVQTKQAPDPLFSAIFQDLRRDFALDIWCRRLGIFVLVWGLFSGISAASGAVQTGENSVGFGFDWSSAFSVWYTAVIRGSLLLGISKILNLLKNQEP
ncbi:helix-turn-helix domain-containing protein [uncultured Dysosmobacter sp.]|uniref:helix-turn-helix domain-containing protein n=1 Tax=uncultured Dysosmobacter sp. TaxID=2591384 RepID=UPI002630ED1C|nr:helix-turn-helix transcriptional regulator [uncultured Dysosmobacter sp.]